MKALKGPTTYRDLEFAGVRSSHGGNLSVDLAERELELKANNAPPQEFGQAMDQVEYLKKAVGLCRAKKVTCILINTGTSDRNGTSRYGGVLCLLARAHGRYALVGPFGWTLPDSCFGNATHLNHRGARLYSEHVKALRAKGWKGVDERHVSLPPPPSAEAVP